MARPIELIISQGRVGDRTGGALPGALKTGRALSRMLGVDARVVGTPAAAKDDDWSECLPAATATLHALRDAVRDAFARDATPVLATNTCGASIGTLPTVAEHHPDAVVLWIDAHGEFDTPGRDVWIHVDWDVLEPGYIPAAYRVDAGMLPHEVAAIFAAIAPEQVLGVELAEFEEGDQGVPSHLSVELILQIFQALRLGR